METKNMLYIVSEYAQNGEIFGKSNCRVSTCTTPMQCSNKSSRTSQCAIECEPFVRSLKEVKRSQIKKSSSKI